MKKLLVALLGAAVVLAALACAGLVFMFVSVMRGSLPMDDGRLFADGSIERVVDGYVSAFLLETGEGGVVLVDAGMDGQAASLLAALERRGYGADDVQAILFTHAHGDHVGGAAVFEGAELCILEADADLLEGRRVADNLLGRLREPAPSGLLADRLLQDGQLLRFGQLQVEVFAVPGHPRGSAAFLARGALFLGDNAASTSERTLTGGPPVFSADREQNRRALAELARRLAPRSDEILWLLPSHQGALEGAGALMVWGEAGGP